MLQKVAYGVIDPVKDLYTKFLRYFQNTDLTLSTQQTSQTPTDVLLARRNRDNSEQAFSQNEINNGSLLNWTLEEADVTQQTLDNGVGYEYWFGTGTVDSAGPLSFTASGAAGLNVRKSVGSDFSALSGSTIEVTYNLSGANNSGITGKGSSGGGATTTSAGTIINGVGNVVTLTVTDTTRMLSIGVSGADVAFEITGIVIQGFESATPIVYDQRVPTSTQKMWFDGVDDYVSGDIGSFYTDNDIITVEWDTFSDDISGINIILAFGSDNSNGIQIITFAGQYRVEFLVGLSVVSANIGGQKGKYLGTFNKNTFSFSITLPDGTIVTNDLTSSAVAFRADGDLYVGKRSSLNDRFFQGSVGNIILKDEAGNSFLHWLGNNNTNAGWTDQIGANDGTVNGSPARYNPSTGAISRDAVQTTAANQPLIVKDGQLVLQNTKELLDFDGTADYMRIPDAQMPTLTNKLQVSVVCRNNNATLGTVASIFADTDLNGQRSWYLAVDANEKIVAALGNPATGGPGGTETGDAIIVLNELQVIGFSFNAGSVTLYKNGVVMSSTTSGTMPSTLFVSISDWTIGSLLNSNSPTNFWDGQIGEIYFSDTLEDDIIKVQQNQMKRYNI